jgi:hypothetical protein
MSFSQYQKAFFPIQLWDCRSVSERRFIVQKLLLILLQLQLQRLSSLIVVSKRPQIAKKTADNYEYSEKRDWFFRKYDRDPRGKDFAIQHGGC